MRLFVMAAIAASTIAARPGQLTPIQGQTPRDTVRRPDPVGTAIIRGRVVAADTGSPIRRAMVSLQPMTPPPPPASPPPPGSPSSAASTQTITLGDGSQRTVTSSVSLNITNMGRPRTATTDAQGAFEFKALPAGRYRLFANPGQYAAAYMASAYGARRSNAPGSDGIAIGAADTGVPIDLTDGQRFDKATIALSRGAVITGRVTDENGDALSRVQVYTMLLPPGSSRPQRTGAAAQTDDLGQFRLYGLAQGDYLVVAEARGPTFVPPNAIENDDDGIGFLTTYFPGTADESSAQRVRTRLATETPGAEIRMVTGRLFRISGMVTDSQGRTSTRMNGSLVRATGNSVSSFGFSTDEQGRFQMRNIPPGSYKLVVRGRLTGPQDNSQNDVPETAVVPLLLNADVEGMVVVTSPGVAITGQVVFEQGPPQLPPGQTALQMRVNAAPGDPQNNAGLPSPQPAVVNPDLTFTMKGLVGEYLLRANAGGQFLKAVTVGGEDITDTPREFKSGDRVTIVLTSRASTLEGAVTDDKGAPVAEASIVVFSEDKASWRFNSIRTRRSSTDPTGRYRMTGLLPGRYYILAGPRERLIISPASQDASFFEQLSKEATTFVIGEDEQRQVDLRMTGGGGQ